jgi:hypothetical protein
MAAIITNNELIPAPPVAQLRYGLFTAAQGPLTLGTRGIGAGIQFITDHCGGAEVYDANCDTHPTKEFVEGSDILEAEPFWIYANKHCGPVGRTPEEMERAVREQLISGEQTQVEGVVWDGGAIANTPALTTSGATVVAPLAPGAGAAIAALENAAYQVMGYNGVIHVNTQAYAALAYSNLVEHDGPRLVTPLGTVLSIGAGYDITGPDGVAPEAGFVWAFMTSQTTIWRSEITVPDIRETFDRELNQYNAVAERVYAVTWDCPETFAVQVPVAAPAVATAPAVPGP